VVEVVFELRKLTGTDQHIALDDEGDVELRETVLARVHIQEPEDQGALKACTQSLEDVEPAPREIDATFEVDDVQLWTEVPVWDGFDALGR